MIIIGKKNATGQRMTLKIEFKVGLFITMIPIRLGLNASQELTSIPVAVLNGMVKVFLAIVTIEVLSSIVRFI